MNNALSTLVNQSLPALSNSSVTYNADRNMFMTTGYTSAAGNTYFQGIHLSDRLAIVLEIGIGYYHTFLNGVQLYCFDGKQKKLIGSQSYNCCYYSDSTAREKSTNILLNYLESQALMLGCVVNKLEMKEFAKQQVLAAATQRHKALL